MDDRPRRHRPPTIVAMTSRRWAAVGVAALAVAVGLLAAGCGPKQTDTETVPPHNPPLFPSYTARPPSPTALVDQGCTSTYPAKVTVNRGWEATYRICGDHAGTKAIITNLSTGVLRVAPGNGRPRLLNCLANPTDPVATVVSRLLPSAADRDGTVWVAPDGCALISFTGRSDLNISLDYTRSGAIFLASSLTKYAMKQVGSNRALSFLNNVGDCTSNAYALWRATGSTPPPVSTVLTTAISGYSACKSVMDSVNKAIGVGTEAKAESTGLLAAASEIGSGAWEDLLKLAIKDPHLLSILPR
jgi:hypothetical protein